MASSVCLFSKLRCASEETSHLKKADFGSLKAMSNGFDGKRIGVSLSRDYYVKS